MPESTSASAVHGAGRNGRDDNQRQNLSYRLATADDLRRFYGEPQRVTTRSVVVLLNGEPAGVIGVAFVRGNAKAFSDYKPQLQPHLKRMSIMRAIKLAISIFRDCGRDVYAVRQEGTEILPKLGFEHVEGEVYRWRN